MAVIRRHGVHFHLSGLHVPGKMLQKSCLMEERGNINILPAADFFELISSVWLGVRGDNGAACRHPGKVLLHTQFVKLSSADKDVWTGAV